jgi:Flp pilus assembly protein TadB
MLSKEDQRRFEQITRHLRESDPKFFARLDHRARARRGRYLVLLTIVLWAALPATTVLAGRVAGAICAVVLVANSVLLWRYRRRWL